MPVDNLLTGITHLSRVVARYKKYYVCSLDICNNKKYKSFWVNCYP